MSRKTLSQDSNSEFHRRKLKWTNQFVEDNIDIIESNYSKFPNEIDGIVIVM